MFYSNEAYEFLKCIENNLPSYENDLISNDSIQSNINIIDDLFIAPKNNENFLQITNTATTADHTKKNQPNFLGKKKKSRKYDKDSIIKKIINHYLNFITKFINIIIIELLRKNDMHFNYELKFYDLYYKYKINLSKLFPDNLKLEDVIKTKKSSKYKKESFSNEEVCQIIKKEEKLKVVAEILENKLFFLFGKIYEKKRKKKYNLKDFGLIDLEINLPNEIELYEDLKEKGKEGEENHEQYIERMDYFKNNFILKKMFIVSNL